MSRASAPLRDVAFRRLLAAATLGIAVLGALTRPSWRQLGMRESGGRPVSASPQRAA